MSESIPKRKRIFFVPMLKSFLKSLFLTNPAGPRQILGEMSLPYFVHPKNGSPTFQLFNCEGRFLMICHQYLGQGVSKL